MSDQQFKTVKEQIEILRKRGLTITNEAQAEDFLSRNNYYRISGYSLTLRKNDVFYEGTTFQNIIDIYSFDHELRHIILKYIETIEVKVKSIYVHEFSRVYGAFGYLNESIFSDSYRHKKILDHIKEKKEKHFRNEPVIKHYEYDLRQKDIPLWAIVDFITFTDISNLYAISNKAVKDAVAQNFGLTMSKRAELLTSYIHSMTIIRNKCAHGSRLFNWLFEHKPSLNKKETALLIMTNRGPDNARFYGFVLIMKRLLPDNIFNELKTSIINLTEKYPFINMKYYGFREDWKEVL